ncbi:serine hydrolase domain-containing protein [Oligoflexus tunisiensis]|uniref:serine hydrolase domain-containing protein n=1 Tax=Oligoflexus tunisiensis TaxID=708132 RepID=UPI000A88E4B6|nr:serine hydrolase domain-containing protein [Oligoflexus tunisiensis]
MRILNFILGCLGCLSFTCFADTSRIKVVQDYLQDLEKRGVFSGYVSIETSENSWEHGYGYRHGPSGEAPDADSLFKIGSMTKLFTGFAILNLADQHKLSLDDPIAKFFPNIKESSLEYQGEVLRIRHLLTHTSGLPDVTTFSYHWGSPVGVGYFLGLLDIFGLRSKPGEVYDYCNFNYFLLGEIISRLSGLSYIDYMESTYFKPLGLNSISMGFPDEADKAYGHHFIFDKSIPAEDVYSIVSFKTYDWPSASDGGLVSSVTDLKKWFKLFGEGGLVKVDAFDRNLVSFRYFAGIKNIGSGDDIVYWHNGMLSPIGYNSDFVMDKKGSLIIVLGNMDAGMEPQNIARHIYEYLESGDSSTLPAFAEDIKIQPMMFYTYSKIQLDILCCLLSCIVLFRRRADSHFTVLTFAFFATIFLFNSFSLPSTKSVAVISAAVLYWIFIALWRRKHPQAIKAEKLAFGRLVAPVISLLLALVIFNLT